MSPSSATIRVSVALDATARSGGSDQPTISDDGRQVAFESGSELADLSYTADSYYHPDWFPEGRDKTWQDEYPTPQVYVHDLVTRSTRLGAFAPREARHWDYYYTYAPSISGDGRTLSFASAAKHMTSPPDTDHEYDVFTRTSTGVVVEQSRGANDETWLSALSADGRTVAFQTWGPLAELPSNGRADIYVRGPAGLRRASTRPQGGAFSGDAGNPDISASGRTVVFEASEFDWTTYQNRTNVYTHETVTEVVDGTPRVQDIVTLVSETPAGQPADSAFQPHISGDGRFVAFQSDVILAPGATPGEWSVYVYDRMTQVTTFIAPQGTSGQSDLDISADGRFIAFSSRRADLVLADTNGMVDVFVADRAFGTFARASVATGGAQANNSSEDPVVSADGRVIAFTSWASNLVAGDANGYEDVFAHQRPAQAAPPDADRDGVGDWRDLCGTTPARVPVDANGCEVPVPGAPVPPILRAIEVTQAVQDWDNSAALISGKDTIVRAHFTASPDRVPASGSLRASRDGVDLGVVAPLNPNGSVAPARSQLAGRAELPRSLNFRLPATWTSGSVTLTFEGVGRCEDTDPSPRDCAVAVTFSDVEVPRVRIVGFSWSDGTGTYEPTAAEMHELTMRLTSAWPVPRVDASTESRPWPLRGAPRMEDALDVLRALRSADELTGACEGCLYYGAFEGPTATRGAFDASIGVAAGVTPARAFDIERNRHVTLLTRALGLPAALDGSLEAAPGEKVGRCGERGSSGDADFPTFAEIPGAGVRPVLGPLEVPHAAAFGLETRLVGTMDEALAVVDPSVTFELTSACIPMQIAQGRWPSLATYAKIAEALRALAAPPPEEELGPQLPSVFPVELS